YREIWMRITDCPRCFGDGNECMKTQIKVNASDDGGKYILRNDQLRTIIRGDPYKKWIEDAAAAKKEERSFEHLLLLLRLWYGSRKQYREIWMRITECPRCFGDGNECMKTQIKVNASDNDGKYILRNDQLRAIIGGDPYKKWIEDAAAAKIDLNTECEYFPWWMFEGAGLTFIVIVAVLAWRCGIFQLLEKKHEEYEDTTKSEPTMKNNLPFQKMQPGIDDPGVYYQYEPENMGFSDPFDRQIQTQSSHDNPAFEADDVEVYRRGSVPRRSSQTQSSSQPAYSPITSHQ
ncbi:unnamed protein product, partial [Darwinula stevensoni]